MPAPKQGRERYRLQHESRRHHEPATSYVLLLDWIPKDATLEDVETAIAAVLHARLASGEKLTNFAVLMNMRYSSAQNHGCARVILPHKSLSVVLKQTGVQVRNKKIRIECDLRFEPKPSTLLFLQRTAYDERASIRNLESRNQQLRGDTHIDAIELGVIRYGGKPTWSFATEWTVEGHNAKLFFEESFYENHRSFRVVYGDHTDETCLSIVVRLTSVQAIAHGYEYGRPYVLFRLALPPAFEEGNFFGSGKQSRWRRSYLDARHQASAPFAWQLRVRPSHTDTEQYTTLLQKLQDASLPRPVPGNFWSFVSPGLYTPKMLDRFRKWLLSIDFRVAFHLQALVSNGLTDPNTLLVHLRPCLDDVLRRYAPEVAGGILHTFRLNLGKKLQLGAIATDCTKLSALLDEAVLSHLEQTRRMQEVELTGKLSSPSILFTHHLIVTPSGLHLQGPDPHKSNRVLRHYDKYTQFFLRVRFAGEDHLQFRWSRDVNGEWFVHERVGGILKNGIEVAGRHFQFLGYSLSALHEYSAWFVTDFYAEVEPGSAQRVRVTPQYIRDHLGDFTKVIDCPSLYGARMAQAFSATDPTVTLADGEIQYIDDITSDTGELMSDGCGTISPELSLEMNELLIQGRTRAEWDKVVNAYQIRVGGAKGVVGVDPRLEGRQLCLRPSMIKFDAPHSTDVEVANSSLSQKVHFGDQALPCYQRSIGCDKP